MAADIIPLKPNMKKSTPLETIYQKYLQVGTYSRYSYIV